MTNTKSTVQSERRDARWCHSASAPGVRMLPLALGRLLLALVVVALGRTSIAGPPEAYQKKWHDDAVNQRIERNIEQYRKGDAVLEVFDAAGKPLSGVRVEVQQTGHEFLFGCNAFVLGQLPTAEENRRYEEAFVRLCNFATVPLYWEGTEPTQGELRYQEGSRDMWRRPPADRYPPWAAKHGITLKGHPLLWHAYNPPWLPKDADQLRELYRQRFREIAGRYGDKIPIFDVVNESLVCSKTYPLYSDDRAYVGWAFAEAAPLFPDSTTLMINEVTSYNFKPAEANPYLAQVKTLLEQGAKIKGIGLQFHYFRRAALDGYLAGDSSDPGKLLDVYEAFSKIGLPLYITEITVPSAGPDGEELQAEVVRDHYRLWFSAPGMAGITWWNLGDGTAVKGENEAQGGLLDNELKPKAAYRVLDQLINQQWKTQTSVRTDANGQARFRGFFGKYQVKAASGDTTGQWEINHTRSAAGSHRLTL
ncbi:MAG: endo-1,4-beta-xylanase [Pirellulaceae bacterium]|nr:endo-1,4-beta-xylanase [Pirellulaceae bacterium]